MGVGCRMGLYALKDVDQVGHRVDLLETAARYQRVEYGAVASALLGPVEQPVLAANGHRSNLPLGMVVVDGDIRVAQEHAKTGLSIKGILDSLDKWTAIRERRLRQGRIEVLEDFVDFVL